MAKKRQKRVLFLGIISLVFLYPVIYMLICSVWEGKNAGVSMMGYYRVLLESPGYLVNCWRTDHPCMYGRDGLCQISVYREEVLACYDGFVYDSSGAGHTASKLYSDGKAGIFEQLEIAYYPGDFFPVWNSVADLYFSVYSG